MCRAHVMRLYVHTRVLCTHAKSRFMSSVNACNVITCVCLAAGMILTVNNRVHQAPPPCCQLDIQLASLCTSVDTQIGTITDFNLQCKFAQHGTRLPHPEFEVESPIQVKRSETHQSCSQHKTTVQYYGRDPNLS